MKHLMLDLETMSTSPGGIIISVAGVQFDPRLSGTGAEFYMNINLEDSIRAGFKLDPQTLKWWLEQKPEILAKALSQSKDLIHVLKSFHEFFVTTNCLEIWGNSASFDCSLLDSYYKHMKMIRPWSHYNERCYRTLINLKPFQKLKKDGEKAHDPIYDCKYQILNLQAFYKENNL